MSGYHYRYYRKRNRKIYRAPTSHSLSIYLIDEFDFSTEEIDLKQFLVTQLFTGDTAVKEKFESFYLQKYGELSLAYWKRTYKCWLQEKKKISNMMVDRIMTIMPSCLSEDIIDSLSLNVFLLTIKRTVQIFLSKRVKSYRTVKMFNVDAVLELFKQESMRIDSDLITIFQAEYEKFSEKYKIVFDCYGGGPLTQEEYNDAFLISDYILKTKLHNDYRAIESDFNLIHKYLARNVNPLLSVIYHISCFDIEIDLVDIKQDSFSLPSFLINELDVKSDKYREYVEKYIAYEMLEIRKKQQMRVIASSINESDLKAYFAKYQNAKNGDNVINMKAEMQGNGGVLNLSIDYIPRKVLVSKIIWSIIKIIIIASIIVGITIFAYSKHLLLEFAFTVLIPAVILIKIVLEEIKSINLNIKQIRSI